jgi:hypothetical protein
LRRTLRREEPTRWTTLAGTHFGASPTRELDAGKSSRISYCQSCFCQLKTGPFDHRKEGHLGHAARTLIIENKAI